MPNSPAHIDLAHQAALRLGHPTLNDNLGYFLLGSTSPDIRVITRRRREEYHFAPLDFEAIGAGVRGMFDSHPHLGTSSDYDGPTQSFIAGYITHLLADETWIVTMYRPYFGNPQVFEDSALGQVMDRAMQMELDRQAWETMAATRSALDSATDVIDIGLFPSESLADWREWVLAAFDRGFSWERLRFMARRIAAGDETHPAHRVAEEFLDSIPESLDRLYNVVSPGDVANFKERTVRELVRAVGDYLP